MNAAEIDRSRRTSEPVAMTRQSPISPSPAIVAILAGQATQRRGISIVSGERSA